MSKHQRSGAALVVTVLLLPALLGMVGLVIDAGRLMVARRQAQNAADAAALAAAQDLVRRRSPSVAAATATSFVQQYNGLSEAAVVVETPPTSGPYAGNGAYAEVNVTAPVSTILVQVLGVNRSQEVRARAVAGYKAAPPGAKVVALNPDARPGLSVSGNGSLVVDGGVAVNSEGGGVDETGAPVGNGNTSVAASVANNSTFRATSVKVVGGVNSPANFRHYDPNAPGSPLTARAVSQADPFLHLPPPTTANGADPTVWPAVSASGNSHVTLYPGVYPSISITSGNVTFAPGIYIIQGGSLKITEQDVTAHGVMFYVTGSDYNVNTGLPDAADYDAPPPAAGNPSFGSVTINASLQFSGYDNPSSPFHGMMFYQRRLNTQAFNIQGNSAAGNMAGAIYAKWAPMKISGQGTYDSQFVVGSFEATGSGTVAIRDAGEFVARSNQVFLVE